MVVFKIFSFRKYSNIFNKQLIGILKDLINKYF